MLFYEPIDDEKMVEVIALSAASLDPSKRDNSFQKGQELIQQLENIMSKENVDEELLVFARRIGQVVRIFFFWSEKVIWMRVQRTNPNVLDLPKTWSNSILWRGIPQEIM